MYLLIQLCGEISPKYLGKDSKTKYNFKKYVLWVVRVSNNGENLKDATPCKRCCCKLNELGFKKIGYSDKEGEIKIVDIRYFMNNHLSRSQKKTAKFSRC